MRLEPIRLRLVPRSQNHDISDPRQAFWQAITRDVSAYQDIASLEGKLCRDFGFTLHRLLIRHLSEPLRSIENTGAFRDLEHILFRFYDGPRSKETWDQGLALDAFTRLLEQRQQIVRESSGLRRVQENVAAASTVVFSLTIAGYSSLSLDLSVGSLNKMATIFDNDFDSFRVFLDAFVPKVFVEVFDANSADQLEFHTKIPESYAQVFSNPPSPPVTNPGPLAEPAVAQLLGGQSAATARERAEWLWRLANGSLLVPILLSLVVLYQGMVMFKEIRASEQEAMKPFLEHELKLLEEDRHRLFREPATPPASPPTVGKQP